MFNRKGFTLVELMIVVAINGILAAIAVANFVAMQYRAKRAEVPSNVDGVKTAEMAYDAAYVHYIQQASFFPSPAVGKAAVTWSAGSNFDTIGWSPDGNVRGAYMLVSLSSTDFRVTGICDVDGDTANASYTAQQSINAGATTGNSVY